MPMRQSFCFPLFTSDTVDFEAACAAAARIGYPAVEWWFRDDNFADQVAIAKRHGLSVASFSGHVGLESGLNDPSQHERIVAELRASIDLAAANDIPNLICFSGNRRAEQSDAAGIEACVAGLKQIAPYAEEKGVNLNLELLNSKVDHPGYQADHTAWGVAVCQGVASPRVKLLYDIYHMQIMEGDVIRTIQDNSQWIGHFHTAGNPGRRDLDDEQELNYTAICNAIRATGYDGFLAHEFSPKGDQLAALETAFRICAG